MTTAFTDTDLIETARVPPGKRIDLRKDFDPGLSGHGRTRESANQRLEEGIKVLAEGQDRLLADDTDAMPIVLQARDAAGKDGTIRHVISGVNPRGVNVTSSRAPSSEELGHDDLWRTIRSLPEHGHIGLFNRSLFEEVLVVRVHAELLERQNLPPNINKMGPWEQRFKEIDIFEKYLVNNGITVLRCLKFFLNVSKEEQKKRLMERLPLPEKNWKFSAADIGERNSRDAYPDAYEGLFSHASTAWAPRYIFLADRKRSAHRAVAAIVCTTFAGLKVDDPTVTEVGRQELSLVRLKLEGEDCGGDPMRAARSAGKNTRMADASCAMDDGMRRCRP